MLDQTIGENPFPGPWKTSRSPQGGLVGDQITYLWIYDTLWLFNVAMENGPFIDDFPIKTSIYRGFSMAMLNNQMVIYAHIHSIVSLLLWKFPSKIHLCQAMASSAASSPGMAAALPKRLGPKCKGRTQDPLLSNRGNHLMGIDGNIIIGIIRYHMKSYDTISYWVISREIKLYGIIWYYCVIFYDTILYDIAIKCHIGVS